MVPASQLAQETWFYFVFFLFGALAFPAAVGVLGARQLSYSVSKILGLLLFGYPIWLLASVGALNYQNKLVITIIFGVCAVGALVLSWRNDKVAGAVRRCWRSFLMIEACSLALFLLYLQLRSFSPDIYGTERFMDMAFFVAAGKSHSFPFADPWLSGSAVNYYYYGSYLMSVIANISHVPYALAYNFCLALLFSQSVIVAAAIVWEYTSSKVSAAIASVLVTCSGTLFYAVQEIRAFASHGGDSYPYSSSTRFYDPSYIINEIPSYSFTVGDMHAHVLGLPFFLVNLCFVYVWYKSTRLRWVLTGVMAVSFASDAMVNSWDAITLFLVFGIAALFKAAKEWRRGRNGEPGARRLATILWLVAPAITAGAVGILMLPFLHAFRSPVIGVGFAPAFIKTNKLKDVQYPTPPVAWLGMWGLYTAATAYALWRIGRNWPRRAFPVVLILTSVLLLVGVELFFVRDLYSVANPPYFRANTVFKFGYHAWTMWSLACCMLLSRAAGMPVEANWRRITSTAALSILCLCFALSLIYPYQAIRQFYLSNSERRAQRHGSLDGSVFMEQEGPGDRDTVQYLNDKLRDRAVLVEAAGDSYTYHGRLSVFTGMIDPIGWVTHEWTWRMDTVAARTAVPGQWVETGYGPLAAREEDVKRIYETTDRNRAAALLRKYHAQYVYVGALERSDYPHLDEAKFAQLGTLIFSSHGAHLYRLNGAG